MYDDHRERPSAIAFRRMTAGFCLSAAGIALLSADSALELGYILSFAPELRKLLLNPYWRLGAGGAITALTFFGSYLLWLRYDSNLWVRVSTLLLLMNCIHLAFWLISNHPELGMPNQKIGHAWLRGQISQIMNWFEFACWIIMMRELNRRVSDIKDNTIDPHRFAAYPGFVVVGMIVSAGVAAILTDWSVWPLERVVWLTPLDSLMLATATTMLMFAASMQMTIGCWRSARLSSAMARSAAAQEPGEPAWTVDNFDEDPWGTRGNAGDHPIW